MFSACGLNCGLCPRYHTDGDSRCPGCAGEGFSDVHPPCGVLSCAQRKGVDYCFECDEYPCPKYDGVDGSDSFITHLNQFKDLDKAKTIGMPAYKAELDEKVRILETLLRDYNDGRRKSFFCLAVNLIELKDLRALMAQLPDPLDSIKVKAKIAADLFKELAEKRGITLTLRK